MLNRWLGILSILAMLVANGAILWRDVVPNWTAGDPPPSEPLVLREGEERRAQVGIYRAAGARSPGELIGKSWTRSRKNPVVGGVVIVATTTILEPIFLPGAAAIPRVRIDTELTYRPDERSVDELEFRIHGLGFPVRLKCEAMASGEFPCIWEVAERRGFIALDSRAPAALGDVLRPFDRLPDLYVGRTWRHNLLDPLRQMLPNLASRVSSLELEDVLMEVTREETVVHRGAEIPTLVVEGGGITAWVTHAGRVLRQEVKVPFLGNLVVLDEIYNEDELRRSRDMVPLDIGPADATPSGKEG